VSERGAASVFAMVAVVLAGAIALQIARLGSATSERARADTAADAAALAAAGALARGASPEAARTDAATTAGMNGAILVSCECSGERPSVVVRVGPATGRARAEVDTDCIADLRCREPG
jgi:secretion/DNA translocation related TadE-like protein